MQIIQKFKKDNKPWPVWLSGSIVPYTKSGGFSSWSGSIPRLRVQAYSWGAMWKATHRCFSLSLSYTT